MTIKFWLWVKYKIRFEVDHEVDLQYLFAQVSTFLGEFLHGQDVGILKLQTENAIIQCWFTMISEESTDHHFSVAIISAHQSRVVNQPTRGACLEGGTLYPFR